MNAIQQCFVFKKRIFCFVLFLSILSSVLVCVYQISYSASSWFEFPVTTQSILPLQQFESLPIFESPSPSPRRKKANVVTRKLNCNDTISEVLENFDLPLDDLYAFMPPRWLGRFGNNVISFLNGLHLAKESNRTFLYPRQTEQLISLSDVFDLSGLKKLGYRFREMDVRFASEVQAWKKCDNHKESLDENSEQLLEWSAAYLFYNCEARCSYKRMFKAIPPSGKYKKAILDLRKSHLNFSAADSVLGVHVRRHDNENCNSLCGIDWNMLQNITSSIPEFRKEKIFIASDSQNKDLDATFWKHQEVKKMNWQDPYVRSLIEKENLEPFVVDFWMLTTMDYFIGNQISTFALLVSMARVSSTGLNRDELRWPKGKYNASHLETVWEICPSWCSRSCKCS
jgi:hypothetical protein